MGAECSQCASGSEDDETGAKEMYRNVILTLLLIVAVIIAFEFRPGHATTQSEPKLSATARQILDRKVPNLVIRHGSPKEAMAALSDATGVKISVDWPSVPNWEKSKIDVELHDMNLGDALSYIFQMDREYYNGLEQVDFDVVDGIVRVAAAPRFPTGFMSLRIYDVRDLLSDDYWMCGLGPDPIATQYQRADALETLIETVAGSRNWDMQASRGGSHGPGEEFGHGDMKVQAGRLLVVETTRGHEQVETALQRLRAPGVRPAAIQPR
jgi:hypothetical protein